MAKPTPQAVKSSLPPTLRSRAEADDPSVFGDAARKAIIWVRSRHEMAGIGPVDWDSDLVSEAVLEYAKYAVHAARENESVAADKKENAREFLQPVVGAAGGSDGQPAPGAAAAEGAKPAWMDGFEARQDPEDGGTRRVP